MGKYIEKLIQFNSTLKYQREQKFLFKLVEAKHNEKVLDIGCGLGRTVRFFRSKGVECFGYDVNDYIEKPDAHMFRSEFHFQFDKVYFMHSFAHIPNAEHMIGDTLEKVMKDDGTVTVITPNRDFIQHLSDVTSYVPDETVVQHYNLNDLTNIFGSNGYVVEHAGQLGNNLFGHCERCFVVARKK